MVSLAVGCHLRLSRKQFLPHRRLSGTEMISAERRYVPGGLLGKVQTLPASVTLGKHGLLLSSASAGPSGLASAPFATPGSRCGWGAREGSQPLPGRAKSKLPETEACSEDQGRRVTSSFYPWRPQGRALPGSQGRLSRGRGRRGQDRRGQERWAAGAK